MRNSELDKLFRDKLPQVTPPVFNNGHWEQARYLLKKEKDKKRRLIWIWGAIILFIPTLTGLYLLELRPSGPGQPPAPDKIPAEVKHTVDLANGLNPENPQESLLSMDERKVSNRPMAMASEAPVNNSLETKFVMKEPSVDRSLSKETTLGEGGLLDSSRNIAVSDPVIGEILSSKIRSKPLSRLSQKEFVLSYQPVLRPGRSGYLLEDHQLRIPSRVAWSGSILLDPAFSSNSPARGFIVGITYEKYFNRHWLIGTRPSLQLRKGEGGFSKFEQFTTYGFSATNTIYGLKANNLQFLSLPVYFAGEFGKHTMEAGASLELLLGARGQLHQVSLENQTVFNIRNLNSGWINTDHMQKFSTNIFIGYKNLITKRLKTGITLFYNPVKIYPGLPNNQSQQINSKWYLGWQALYYIR